MGDSSVLRRIGPVIAAVIPCDRNDSQPVIAKHAGTALRLRLGTPTFVLKTLPLEDPSPQVDQVSCHLRRARPLVRVPGTRAKRGPRGPRASEKSK